MPKSSYHQANPKMAVNFFAGGILKVKTDELQKLIISALVKLGYYDQEERQTVANSLMYAQTHGHQDQGVCKILAPYIKPDPAATDITFKQVNNCTAQMDGGHRAAVYALWQASQIAMELAENNGIGAVYINNIASGSGSLGFFADRIAKRGYEAQITTSTFPKMAAPGGTGPALGINTVAYGFPYGESSVIIDMTMAAMPLMQVIFHPGPLPAGVAYDVNCNPTTDPQAAAAGTLRAFGDCESPKGAVMATALQFWAQVMSGARGDRTDWGARVQATKIPDLMQYFRGVQELTGRITSAGNPAARMPGQRAAEFATRCQETGVVEIDDDLYQRVMEFLNP